MRSTLWNIPWEMLPYLETKLILSRKVPSWQSSTHITSNNFPENKNKQTQNTISDFWLHTHIILYGWVPSHPSYLLNSSFFQDSAQVLSSKIISLTSETLHVSLCVFLLCIFMTLHDYLYPHRNYLLSIWISH